MSDKPENPSPESKGFEFPPIHAPEEPSSTPETPVTAAPTPAPTPSEPKEPKEPFKDKFLRVAGPVITFVKGWVVAHKTPSLIIGFVLISSLMWGISKMRERREAQDDAAVAGNVDEIPVNAMEVRLARFQDTINAVGTLKGEAEVELRFEADGIIEEFNVTEGAKIAKGTIIARLSQTDARLKVQRAKNELEQMEKLFALGGVSKTKLEEARLNLEVAQTELRKTEIKAPREGILGDKAAEVGEFVTPQRKIATLVSIKNVVVKVGIIEKQVDKVYPGQKMMVTVDAYPGNIFEGAIESISPLITGESKTFEITAKFPNADSLLLPGMFARSRVITYEADDAIAVPNDALAQTAGGFQVFVINKDNAAEARDVSVGYVSNEQTQIQSGLSAGEIVVIQKPAELKAGAKVKIIEMQK